MRKKNQEFTVKKERLISLSLDVKYLLYFVGIICLVFFVWFLLYYKHIYVYLHSNNNNNESILFSIITSMTLLMFMLSCGFQISYSKTWLKIMSIIAVIYLVYLGFVNVGIGIEFRTNFGLLNQIRYESNSKYGLLFFIENWLFWSYVYIISLFLESE